MILVDLNLLIYAVNRDAPAHELAVRWWNEALSGEEPVGSAWTVVLGFLRLTTHPRVMPRPLTAEQAVALLDEWFDQPPSRLVEPTERHWGVLKQLLEPLGTAGNLTSDAHLAALAVEYGARLYSTDNDFARFPRVHWVNPLSS